VHYQRTRLLHIFPFILLSLLVACDELEKSSKMALTPVSFSVLPGWGSDDLLTLVAAFDQSCQRIARKPANGAFGVLKEAGSYGKWQLICANFALTNREDSAALRSFFETHFTPYQVSAGDEPIGLFTGYYEASLHGSRTPKPPFQVPLYKRPDDLVLVELGEFRDSLKGRRIAGRVMNGKLKPYENRAEIVSGSWPHNDQALLWVDNPVDAFFVQIQGSGVVQLDDGSSMRIGYDGHNGHVYYAIGRELIRLGVLTKESVSMQSIRAWLEANPDRASEIMNTNPSYIFFREISGQGPVGGEGVTLTAERSLAIDKNLLPYGLPLWVNIDPPLNGHSQIQRLMIAQDSGGAIRGAVRGDVFWGHGELAEERAGHMKSSGRYWALLPK
jgi:membrane-bound lytic murein transglycosylase A